MVKPVPYDIEKLATHAALYQQMLGTQGWDVYYEHLEKEEADQLETFLAGAPPEYTRGYVAALRFARDYPSKIVSIFHTQKER